jgi:hypothetical protein
MAYNQVERKMATKTKAKQVKVAPPVLERRPVRGGRVGSQVSYMKAPGVEHVYEVGDTVEVFCVQFRSNVFLTDGWMVPDRILWYPLNSEHLRPVLAKKSARQEIINY